MKTIFKLKILDTISPNKVDDFFWENLISLLWHGTSNSIL